MSFNGSGDEQSEDGELQQSPDAKQKPAPMEYRLVCFTIQIDVVILQSLFFTFSVSDEDGETIDSLDIKPPQAQAMSTSRSKQKREERSHHKRSERHRDDRSHSHRSKHQR